MNDIINKELILPQPIDIVWKAISEEKSLNEWFMPASFKAEIGYEYTFDSTDPNCGRIHGKVLDANPYTLRYTWIEEGMEAVTEVTWQLSIARNGTCLKLTHSGFKNYDSVTAVKMFTGFNAGWGKFMDILEQHLCTTLNA